MIKERSPQYPSIGLKTAIDKVDMVWNQGDTNILTRGMVIEFMGYSSVSGKSLGAISALSKYGLLEGRGDRMRVSELAVEIITNRVSTKKWSQAVWSAARKPIFFENIYQTFGKTALSDEVLERYFDLHGFTTSGIKSAIHSFRETDTFVRDMTGTQDIDMISDNSFALRPKSSPKSASVKKDWVQGSVGIAESIIVGRPRIKEVKVDSLTSSNVCAATNIPTVILTDDGFEISSGGISSIEQFDKLMRRLHAAKALLEE